MWQTNPQYMIWLLMQHLTRPLVNGCAATLFRSRSCFIEVRSQGIQSLELARRGTVILNPFVLHPLCDVLAILLVTVVDLLVDRDKCSFTVNLKLVLYECVSYLGAVVLVRPKILRGPGLCNYRVVLLDKVIRVLSCLVHSGVCCV